MTPGSIYGLTVNGPSQTVQETFTVRDDLSKVRGTHVFKAGYEWMRFRMNATQAPSRAGTSHSPNMTAGLQPNGVALPRTGNTFAGFLLGQVAQATFTKQLASWLPRSTINSFYVQDDWKITKALTLSYGVRYSNESPFTTKYGQMSQFSPTTVDPVSGLMGAVVHPTGALSARDNNNFQPRVGVAWHPLERLAIRSGFGLYTVDVKFPATLANFQEYTAQANYQQPPGNPTPIYAINAIPAPVTYTTRSNGTAGFIGTNYSARSQDWWDPNLRNPYTMNWDLSTQYQLSRTYMVELLYQGSAGVGLIENWNVNAFPVDFGANNPALRAAAFAAPQNYLPVPQFGAINFRSNFGHSTYHSGTIRVETAIRPGPDLPIVLYSLQSHRQLGHGQLRRRCGAHSKPVTGKGAGRIRPPQTVLQQHHVRIAGRQGKALPESGRMAGLHHRRLADCVGHRLGKRGAADVLVCQQPV